MALNRKLTPIILGRVVKSIDPGEGILSVNFNDGSVMRIKIGGSQPLGEWKDHAVKTVRQSGVLMNIDFTDDTTLEIELAEAMSSVLLRDGKGALEYAD